ncbi:ABC transporter ATP-binding protein [Acidicapsa ligni]|uniref:ABC transporter ATP-binding protein n=1 Tax=Acidicapsa ligni TaxID=542300 RepID=UPI0021E0CF36|nr:ATP-binding cassette domain-containing protein [Acidicapsa ligni]
MLELNLQAHRGSFHLKIECVLASPWTVIYGPSGAGKSTLLRMIAGLEKPDSGNILFDDRPLTDTAKHFHKQPGQRGIGLAAQQPALFPHLSVKANVMYGIKNLDSTTCKARLNTMLDLVGAAHLVDRWPRTLSGGEAQRVSLARTLAPIPRLLLLDEPLSALDAEARDQVLAQLQGWLAQQNIQTILVTHDAADALATSAEVAMIHEGHLTALGPASQVLAAERQRILNRLNRASN